MTSPAVAPRQLFRIWIVTYQDWQPNHWQDVPPWAIALEAAEEMPLSASQARSYLEGFNTQMLEMRRRLWAVAVPVTACYDGDAQVGREVAGHGF